VTHGAVASAAFDDPELVTAVLEDFEGAEIPERLRVVLRLLKVFTLTPAELTPESFRAVREQGVTDAAVSDAIHIAAIFNCLDRVADVLDFAVPTDGGSRAAERMLKFGYLRWIGATNGPAGA